MEEEEIQNPPGSEMWTRDEPPKKTGRSMATEGEETDAPSRTIATPHDVRMAMMTAIVKTRILGLNPELFRKEPWETEEEAESSSGFGKQLSAYHTTFRWIKLQIYRGGAPREVEAVRGLQYRDEQGLQLDDEGPEKLLPVLRWLKQLHQAKYGRELKWKLPWVSANSKNKLEYLLKQARYPQTIEQVGRTICKAAIPEGQQ